MGYWFIKSSRQWVWKWCVPPNYGFMKNIKHTWQYMIYNKHIDNKVVYNHSYRQQRGFLSPFFLKQPKIPRNWRVIIKFNIDIEQKVVVIHTHVWRIWACQLFSWPGILGLSKKWSSQKTSQNIPISSSPMLLCESRSKPCLVSSLSLEFPGAPSNFGWLQGQQRCRNVSRMV